MAMRLTGLSSGMDTQSIIEELVAAKRTKVDDTKRAQTRLEWKQETWKELNSKITKLYNGTLGNMRLNSAFYKKTTLVSNPSAVSVITGDGAMNSVQTMRVTHLAKAGYLTGGPVTSQNGNALTADSKVTEALGITSGSKFEITTGGKSTTIEIDDSTKVSDVLKQLQDAGVTANFDEKNQRFYIGAKSLGKESDFTMTAIDGTGTDALDKLGLLLYDSNTLAAYDRYAKMDTNANAKQAELDKMVADRLVYYKQQLDSLNNSITQYTDKNTKLADKTKDMYGVDITLLNSNDKTALQDRIDELEAKSSLTSSEQEELDKSKGVLSAANEYSSNLDKIQDEKDAITNMSDYILADGTAGTVLISEEEAALNGKIQQALQVASNPGLAGSADAHKVDGQDSEIYLNGAKYTSDTNVFEINGMTITCTAETGTEEVTLTTQDDTSGIYDMIKGFIKEYSALINEMDKLYNADSAKGYEPLTDEEKDSMSDSEIEKWENKVKDALLRRDSTLGTVSSAMKVIMAEGVEVNGKKMYLSDFGIETLSYFEAAENEHNAYHIFGDEEDSVVSSKPNELMAMISADPETVTKFFVGLSRNLYSKMSDLMARTEYSSSFTVYDDLKMKEDYTDYTAKIKEQESKLKDYEDKWYAKFAAMETALAKMQSNANAVTSLLGG